MGFCVFGVIWVYTVFARFMTIPSLYLLYSFSRAITAAEIACLISYKRNFVNGGENCDKSHISRYRP